MNVLGGVAFASCTGRPGSVFMGAILVAATLATPASASTCFGTTGNGRIEGAVALPPDGPNFTAYAILGVKLGRNFVHQTVRDIVLASYANLAATMPGLTFVYGETGLRYGGPMQPHRTHESGTSVDFMVPVRDRQARPAELPRAMANRYGYDLEFDGDGKLDGLQIDFAAIAAHLHQLDVEARKHGTRIARVILDPQLAHHLAATPDGKHMAALPFMKTKPWVRHDEHYHVDFAIRCQPKM